MSNDLITRYEQAARVHGEATERGDSERANDAHDIIASVYKELRDSRELANLLDLMDSKNTSVKMWAAAHCLATDEQRSVKTLELLSNKPGILGFNAQMTLTEWRAGRLQFPNDD